MGDHPVVHRQSDKKASSSLVPICSNCSRLKLDDEAWVKVSAAFIERNRRHLSHGICPACFVELYPELTDVSS